MNPSSSLWPWIMYIFKSLGSQTLDEEYHLLVLLVSKVITLLKLFVMLSCMSFKVIIN